MNKPVSPCGRLVLNDYLLIPTFMDCECETCTESKTKLSSYDTWWFRLYIRILDFVFRDNLNLHDEIFKRPSKYWVKYSNLIEVRRSQR